MMKALLVFFFVSIAAFAAPSLVPLPLSVEMKEGEFTLTPDSRIVYETRDQKGIESSLKPLGEVLASELELLSGVRPKVVEGEFRAGDLVLRFEKTSSDFTMYEAEQEQGYRLEVSPKSVVISSRYYKGVAYGTATLLQLFEERKAPCLLIKDQPVAAYRAVMLDVARQVHSPEVVRDVIRMSRLYKMRYVHLHLTDDQNFTFPFEPITGKLEGNFAYTRKELLDLVAYADARGITLIPEMDLPGHSSKLKKSGYLGEIESDFDVAAPENYAKIGAIVADMMAVFASSPYFHMGGDESGAGRRLVPFLSAMNTQVRKANRRMLVWEGFHGAPTKELPPTGDDRIIVMAWESTYNAPWDLLNAGYELINASWRPLYIVGGGNPVHPGSTAGRKFPAEEIYHWDKNTFMHWEPGRPVYEDRGPKDPVKGDHEWSAALLGKEDQMLGGQLLFWEQSQETVMNDLRDRIGPLAERLWSHDDAENFGDFAKRDHAVRERIMPIIQPVKVVIGAELLSASPMDQLYTAYRGESALVSFENRSKVKGRIRYVDCSFSNSFGWIDFKNPVTPTYEGHPFGNEILKTGGFGVRAQLFREDGTAVAGQTWSFFNNWEPRVMVTEYEIGAKTLPRVGDMTALPEKKMITRYELPMLRGPLAHVSIRGQKMESVLRVPESGEFKVSMKTQSGHATLYLDVNQNGEWDKGETLIANTPNTEKPQLAKVTLKANEKYPLRVDHNSGMPRPVVIVTIEGPGIEKRTDVSEFLSLPK